MSSYKKGVAVRNEATPYFFKYNKLFKIPITAYDIKITMIRSY
jgi:hypothetical protein